MEWGPPSKRRFWSISLPFLEAEIPKTNHFPRESFFFTGFKGFFTTISARRKDAPAFLRVSFFLDPSDRKR
jgi:hypothetical protein